MPQPPWTHPTGVRAVVDQWQASGAVKRCFTAERSMPPASPEYGDIPASLPASLRDALTKRGVASLYSHQVQAIDAARSGRHVVIATPTASGKSLCFHLPVLAALAEDPTATALFVYPTKALSRDQEHNLRELMREAGVGDSAMVFDGDTPGDARRAVRERCRIVLTNPDMLHAGILPNHARWASLFQGLKYVVLDELHTYRGVFGTHMAHVLGRLRRVAAFHGSRPTFIAATATIGNPREHGAKLIGVTEEQVELVDKSGAPRATREAYVYNPPVVNEDLQIRASTLKQAVNLAADLVRAKVPTIVFGPSRNSVEVMLKYLRAKVGDVAGADAVMAYRGGYLPETRRRIEAGLRAGQILCVVATNALELGIDIGDLSAVVCAGYPGSVAGTWQRFGRAGRRGETSIAVLVCGSDALDQYLAREPKYLFEAGAEEARIDPSNVEILIQHLKCATFEAPFEVSSPGPRPASPEPALGETYLTLDAEATRDALEYLRGHGLVHESGGRYHWAGEAYPASSVSLRNIGWDNFVIIDVATNKSIAELDFRATHTMLHEQAIYQHDAEQYQVERLDYENHKAFVRKVEPDYFTTALTYRTVGVIEPRNDGSLGRARIGFGDVKVIEKVTGYKKIKFFTHENAGYGDVHLPEMQMHTTSFWLTVPEAVLESLPHSRATLIDGLRGLGAALETVSTLFLMCDPRDLGQTLGDGGQDGQGGAAPLAPGRDPHSGRTGQFDPTVFLFDALPGGVGLAERIFERARELCWAAGRLIRSCPCPAGCPACVGPGSESSPRKRVALELLAALGLTAHDVSAGRAGAILAS
ncbi:MAG: DEAD/DEAH box helicase [Myxococcales bacterium]|nr:MAG: DEAD/DEAH box helicase [Myxococcales bacterium]